MLDRQAWIVNQTGRSFSGVIRLRLGVFCLSSVITFKVKKNWHSSLPHTVAPSHFLVCTNAGVSSTSAVRVDLSLGEFYNT